MKYDENMPGVDIDYVVKFLNKIKWIISVFLKYSVVNENVVDEKRPTMYVANHGQGFWGIIDVILALHYWYIKKGFKTPLYLISEEIVFKLPIMRYLALKAGLKNASRKNVEMLLKSGASVVIPPGGDGELLKPVWMKDRPVFTKSIYCKGRMRLKTQTWFLDSALKMRVPIVSVSISGTHEMTPIIYTSFWIHKYSGMAYWRRKEFLPGYPITLNIFINAFLFICLFMFTSLSSNVMWWIVGGILFVILHVYIDFVYTYPIIFRKIYIKFGNIIDTSCYNYENLNVRNRKELRFELLRRIDLDIREGLSSSNKLRNDIFSKFYRNVYIKNELLKKIWKATLKILTNLYMRRYENYKGDPNEYFIKELDG